jgi:site-specific DNA recombinase
MNEDTLRYFIYVRKSTGGEERQARSIDDQLAEIRELVAKMGLEIVGSFEETQSAMTKGRPQFGDMLKRIEAGEADGIIAWHPDRLARNAFDGGQVIDLIDQGKIRDLKFCTFWFEPTAQGKLMLNLAFGQSKYYSDSLSVNIRRGQRQKTKEGVWAWKAPVGYLNDPIKRTIVPDPAKAPLVKQAFETYAAGKHTLVDIRQAMNTAGLRGVSNNVMSLSRFQYFLKNPFYYGVFRLNEELHEGSHEPLISKALFDSVQEMMQRRSKPNTLRLKKSVYRGLLRCASCGWGITMETQKGHNYLRCTKRVVRDGPQPYAREESVTEQIAQALIEASIPDHWAEWMIQELESERAAGNDSGKDVRERSETEIAKLNVKLDRLTVAYLDAGAFSAAEFRRRKADVIGAKRKLLDDLTILAKAEESRFEPIIRFVNGSKQRKYIASRAIPQELREEFQKTGSNLKLDDRKIKWEPTGASQLVVDQGRFAQTNTRAPKFGARVFGETGLSSPKWSDGESNPDLLNAIQPSSRPKSLQAIT